MDEDFDKQKLITPEALQELRQLSDAATVVRLLVHCGVLGAAIALAVAAHGSLWVVPATVLLAALIASMFAPFHECTHTTAFATPVLNRVGVWIGGLFSGMSPSFYRDFHFQHHRHTQDPERDPEIALDPENTGPWPRSVRGWMLMITHVGLLMTKLRFMLSHWFRPRRATGESEHRRKLSKVTFEFRVIGAFWFGLAVAAALGVPGALAMIVAFCLSHVFLGIWLQTEHTGRPCEGSILERTRTVETHALVRYFLWNMNYHAEHHAWPAIPWYALPKVHERVRSHVDAAPGYLALHRDVYAALG